VSRLPVHKNTTPLSVRSRWLMTCCAWASAPALATTSVPIRGSLIICSMIWGKDSLLAKPVTSAGFAAHPKPFRIPSMPSRASSPSGGDQRRGSERQRLGSARAGSCVFLSRPRCATLDIIFVEHALDDRVGRSPEPALGRRFGSAQGTAQQRRTANLDPIDADGDNCARADVGAAPQPAAAGGAAPIRDRPRRKA
jgi:hypothetical protein